MERHGLDKLVDRRTEAKRKRSACATAAASCRPGRARPSRRTAWRPRRKLEGRAKVVT
jgi:hypothetical protein